ncbi:hypothetical protein JJB07_11900 [Tumebacillus sp. ITR2]|uniref:Uncharacterized protein n=1 Tax=Tumebacillus amylolyticus TaxID=2801339 RepID=A0ABS1JAT7_9BACL|nr:hypothetical protein [Tumebacillus amylolyticus]MBL0387356.1 hypothetical protein [Tumebacillus amylolyticus]
MENPSQQPNPAQDLTPEDIVNDYLIGEHELEQLRHGFQAPVQGQPCDGQK